MPDEILAHIVRSSVVEGAHYGSAVLVDTDGSVIASVGDAERLHYPRSCAKPLQAVAMLRAGLTLPAGPQGGDELYALATSSHSGEAFHLEGALRILASAGLAATQLQNTPDLPLDDAERLRWQTQGLNPSSLAQNCSGKHAAMLVTCAINGWDSSGYLDPGHPLQRAIHSQIEELTGTSIAWVGVDGCGAPVHAIPLVGLARAFGRIAADGAAGSAGPVAGPASAQGRLARAISANPLWLGGTGRWVTRVLQAVPGLVAKDGAEAVFAAGLPDGRALAVKISDGGERAIGPVVTALLASLGVAPGLLEGLAASPIMGHGRVVGAVESRVVLR